MRTREEIGRGRKSDAGGNRRREEIGDGRKSETGGNRRRMSGGSGAVYFGREAAEAAGRDKERQLREKREAGEKGK